MPDVQSPPTLQKKPRLEWVDYAKGLAIILVVYRHALYGVMFSGLEVDQWLLDANEIVYSFRMPLFFILSGLFAAKSIQKRNTLASFGTYKFSTILYPYLIWGVIQIGLQIILSNYTNSSRTWFDFVLLLIQPRAIDQLWYLYALFNVSILFYLLYGTLRLSNIWMLGISILLFGLSTFVQAYSLIHDAIYFLIFFVIGHMTSNFFLSEKNATFFHSFKPFLISFPIFWATQYYWLHNREMNIYLFAVIALIGVFFIFALSFLLSKYQVLKVIRNVGRYSLHVYLMHVLIISATRIGLMKVFGVQSTELILIIAWILGTSIPVILFSQLKTTWFRYLFSLQK